MAPVRVTVNASSSVEPTMSLNNTADSTRSSGHQDAASANVRTVMFVFWDRARSMSNVASSSTP